MWDYYSLVPNQKHQIRQMDQIRITGFFGFCATQKISNLIEFGIFSNKILETSMLRILKIKKDGSVRVKFIIEMQNSQNIAKIVATFTWNLTQMNNQMVMDIENWTFWPTCPGVETFGRFCVEFGELF